MYSGHNCSCTSDEALPGNFILITSCRTETESVSRMEKAGVLDHSIVVAAVSRWRRRLSACVSAHGEHFEHILWCFHGSACYVNAENF